MPNILTLEVYGHDVEISVSIWHAIMRQEIRRRCNAIIFLWILSTCDVLLVRVRVSNADEDEAVYSRRCFGTQ